jgi:hypothetical protein
MNINLNIPDFELDNLSNTPSTDSLTRVGPISIDPEPISYDKSDIEIDVSDDAFLQKFNSDLDVLRNQLQTALPSVSRRPHYSYANSPLTLSNDNSDSDGDHDNNSAHYDNNSNRDRDRDHDPNSESCHSLFRNLTHKEVERSLDKYYDDDMDTKYSSELDVLITYLKGQKNLYIQAKNICQNKLNMLLIPSLIATAAITIFAPFIQGYSWSGGFISALNALTTMLISLSNYLKLETAIITFYNTANQYDKLETSLEFVTSKMLFITSSHEKSRIVLDKIQETEKKISEIKEWNSLFVPEEIRQLFPIICHINVFSFIKRIEVYKKNLVAKFKDIKNEIRYILFQLEKHNRGGNDAKELSVLRFEKRLEYLSEVKEKIKEEMAHYRNAYTHIDEIFTKEINHSHHQQNVWWYLGCYFQKKGYPTYIEHSNPVIHKYLNFVFVE